MTCNRNCDCVGECKHPTPSAGGGAVACAHRWQLGYGEPSYCIDCGALEEPPATVPLDAVRRLIDRINAKDWNHHTPGCVAILIRDELEALTRGEGK